MSKEEKLFELGYKRVILPYMAEFIKSYKREIIVIQIHFHRNNEIVGYVDESHGFGKQQDIDQLQEAYNVLQQDLKELENETIL